MSKVTNVLFVAFEFPPFGGAGVQRPLKFIKYLPDFDIKPIVITVKEDDYLNLMPRHPMDPSLCREFPADLIVERIHCPAAKHHKTGSFMHWIRSYTSVVENFYKLWMPNLKAILPSLIEKYKPHCIYITLPPFAMGPLWIELMKDFKLPIIFDFRDAWSQWCVAPNASIFHYWRKLLLERKLINNARYVLCTSKQIKEDLIKVHQINHNDKIYVINNGYDEEIEFDNPLTISSTGKIVIGYVGSFYYTPESRDRIFRPWWKRPIHRMMHFVPRKEDWLYRSPYFFFKVIHELLIENPALRDRLEIRFAGKTPDWLIKQIQGFQLEDICKHFGYLSHEAVINFQKDCDALLITSSKVIGGRDYSIAGKTYEYFTMGKPILGFVCEGEQKDILIESGMAVIFNPDDTLESVEKMKKIINRDISLTPSKEKIVKYHRKNLTSELAKLIHSIQ